MVKIPVNGYKKCFSQINLNDVFFDTLRASYSEFNNWFIRKHAEFAYVMYDGPDRLQAFLYLKEERGPVEDTVPHLPYDHYLKVGTFKINAHGSKLGERFVKKIFDHALDKRVNKVYVTVFSSHHTLINLLKRYGFIKCAVKVTANGSEDVLVKDICCQVHNIVKDYPLISVAGNHFLLSVYPDYHSRLFPDSILNNEHASIVDDVSHTNCIQKIYICKMPRVAGLNPGDSLVIYRTTDGRGPAEYRSVATSLCMVEEVKQKTDFSDLLEFLRYCSSRSVFSVEELTEFYTSWKNLYTIKLTYNT